jgi:hypothetical protein
MKTSTKSAPSGVRKGYKGVASRGRRPPSDEDEDLDSDDTDEEWLE